MKETVELVSSVIHNVITNSIAEMNNLLYAGENVVVGKLGKMRKNRTNESEKNLSGREVYCGVEKRCQ